METWKTIYSNENIVILKLELSSEELRVSWFNENRHFICNAKEFLGVIIAWYTEMPTPTHLKLQTFNLIKENDQEKCCELQEMEEYDSEKMALAIELIKDWVTIGISRNMMKDIIPILTTELNSHPRAYM